jgi:hypothetical protein
MKPELRSDFIYKFILYLTKIIACFLKCTDLSRKPAACIRLHGVISPKGSCLHSHYRDNILTHGVSITNTNDLILSRKITTFCRRNHTKCVTMQCGIMHSTFMLKQVVYISACLLWIVEHSLSSGAEIDCFKFKKIINSLRSDLQVLKARVFFFNIVQHSHIPSRLPQ